MQSVFLKERLTERDRFHFVSAPFRKDRIDDGVKWRKSAASTRVGA